MEIPKFVSVEVGAATSSIYKPYMYKTLFTALRQPQKQRETLRAFSLSSNPFHVQTKGIHSLSLKFPPSSSFAI